MIGRTGETVSPAEDGAMRVYFRPPRHGHERLLSEAEIHFVDGLLGGTRLLGFGVWRDDRGQLYVTLPSRAIGDGAGRRHIHYLCSADGQADAVRRVKGWILGEYRKAHAPSASASRTVTLEIPS